MTPARCIKCSGDSTVIDSRHGAKAIRRRRKCQSCGFRWTTMEVPEGTLLIEQSTKRFAQFRKDLDELIARFTEEGLT